MPNSPLTTPYADILAKLIGSIMRAQADILEKMSQGVEVNNIPDQLINRHFVWLSLHAGRGLNRHLYDGSADNALYPLRNQELMKKHGRTGEIADLFKSGGSIPIDNDGWTRTFVRTEPTRLSSIVKNEMTKWAEIKPRRGGKAKKDEKSVSLPSPLYIAEIALTVPSSPGSREFAFLSLRNFIIESASCAFGERDFEAFDDSDLIEAIEAINTYRRVRFFSRGNDKIPMGTKNAFHRIIRELFCLKGYYDLWFAPIDQAISYLRIGKYEFYQSSPSPKDIKPKIVENQDYELSPRPNLQKMPDIGDVANLIWGLPVPVRGSDVIFRGGIKFPRRKGLVLAVHGGPGSGKTSLALGIGAALAGFGIGTFFFSAEETEEDLRLRANSLVPDAYRRLSFYPASTREWLDIFDLRAGGQGDTETIPNPGQRLDRVISYLASIEDRLSSAMPDQSSQQFTVKSPCRLVVVLDGLHDLVNRSDKAADSNQGELRQLFHGFLERCKKLEALVILTVGENWQFGAELDYLVDTAVHLLHDTISGEGGKPERLLNLSKARHQSCSAGTHSFQISGEKGLRFTPQIHFCLETASIWKMQLHDERFEKRALCRTARSGNWTRRKVGQADFASEFPSVRLYRSSNIFINGQGSGGKAGMALKIASAPSYKAGTTELANIRERILAISFLYPEDYYFSVHSKMRSMRDMEYTPFPYGETFSRLDVIQFYPGFLKPSALFNRIRWAMEEAELNGDPYTTVILDGLHNVFIQFPDLEKMQMVWPQLYSMLRQRSVTIVTTHTVLMVAAIDGDGQRRKIDIDDFRSDPLRHALVQKTDYSFEVDPVRAINENSDASVEYEVRTLSAIGQPLPDSTRRLCWHREQLFFYDGGVIPMASGQKRLI